MANKNSAAKKNREKLGARVAYRVSFGTPPEPGNEQTEFFFASLAAIYSRFSAKQIGCRLSNLYNVRVADGRPYFGKKSEVERIEVLFLKREAGE